MTIQKIKNPLMPDAPATDALTGNSAAKAAAEKSKTVLEEVISPALNVKLRDLPTKKERLLALADMIERHELTKRNIGFNMAVWHTDLNSVAAAANSITDRTGHSCGTAACIAGWASLNDGGRTSEDISNHAANILNLNWSEQRALFRGKDSATMALATTVPMSQISPQYAVAVIRDFAESDQVRWSHFDNTGKRIK